MRISYWSSDVCSSDLHSKHVLGERAFGQQATDFRQAGAAVAAGAQTGSDFFRRLQTAFADRLDDDVAADTEARADQRTAVFAGAERRTGQQRQTIARGQARSEEHTSELQSLMRISYAVFCLKKKKKDKNMKLK